MRRKRPGRSTISKAVELHRERSSTREGWEKKKGGVTYFWGVAKKLLTSRARGRDRAWERETFWDKGKGQFPLMRENTYRKGGGRREAIKGKPH